MFDPHIETAGRLWKIPDDCVIGSSPQAPIHIQSDQLSDYHCRLDHRNQKCLIRDLNSRTGTFVNGVQIKEAYLIHNDCIKVGSQELIFKTRPENPFQELQSECPNWNQKLHKIPQIARSTFPVLIIGPSGTGKELIAEKLHHFSQRCDAPLLKVNCSALTETLTESELFGHTRGSFTGAINDRKGAFEAARGGTLFLDEIGDLPLSLQAKLLRALENHEIKPVGSDRTVAIDVRVVTATHHNLAKMVALGNFREDLYYRLNVIQVQTPALKDRMPDFDSLLFQFAKQFRVGLSHPVIQMLKEHDWPGNIRELKNYVARVSVLYGAHSPTVEQAQCLLENRVDLETPRLYQTGRKLKDVEKDLIIQELQKNFGNQRVTAERLGMPKSTLHDRIREFEIDVKAFKKRRFNRV